jgi:mRNA-degrading endonuclease RelE of RelBE toxin-antitoxin system
MSAASVPSKYHIAYEINDDELLVLVLGMPHRRAVNER